MQYDRWKRVRVYGAAAVVVFVVVVEDVDVLDVQAGVGPVNEEAPKSASTTPCNLARPSKEPTSSPFHTPVSVPCSQ